MGTEATDHAETSEMDEGPCYDNEKVLAALMNSPVGVYILQNRKFIHSNRKFQEITGYSQQELAEIYPLDLVVAEDRDLLVKNAKAMLKNERNEAYHFRIIDKQGNTRWIMESVASISCRGQQAVLANFMDTTESENLRAAFLDAPIGHYIIQDGKFVFCNPKFVRITGLSEQDLYEIDPINVVYPDDRRRVKECAVQMIKKQRSAPYQFRVMNAVGDFRWVSETVFPIIHNGKRAVLGYFVDVTESHGIMASFMSSPIGIYIICDNQFIFANPKFQETTGFTEAELLEKKPLDLVVAEDKNHVRQCAVDMLKWKRNDPYQYRVLTKQNQVRWITETVSYYLYKDRRAALGYFMDITELKNQE